MSKSIEELRLNMIHALGLCDDTCNGKPHLKRDEDDPVLVYLSDLRQAMQLFDQEIALRVEEARIDENQSMKDALRGYSPNDWCHNHDKHVPQCYACRKAKWGNIFCKEFEAIIDERLATLHKHSKEGETSNE